MDFRNIDEKKYPALAAYLKVPTGIDPVFFDGADMNNYNWAVERNGLAALSSAEQKIAENNKDAK